MTRPEDVCFVLPLPAVDDLSGTSIGGLMPIRRPGEDAVSVKLRDTFDQDLRGARRLLVEIGDRLELWEPAGPIRSQTSRRKGDFPADLAEGPVKAALSDLSPLRSLLPLATGTLRTDDLALIDDEGKTQARATLRLLTPEGAPGLALVAVQGLRGYDKALNRLTRRIVGLGGHALTEDASDTAFLTGIDRPLRKPELQIGASDAAFDTATDIIAAHIPLARQNEAGTIADLDTEFLHDYRVALRKIRSALSLFEGVYAEEDTQALKSRFSTLMDHTGRLRDLDVYLLDRDTFYALVPDSMHGGLDRMFATFAKERAAGHKALAKHLKSAAYTKEIKGLAKLFDARKKLARGPNADKPSYTFGCELIWTRYRKICRIASGITADTPDDEVHDLRIHCKKLRYLMEFFAPVFPKTEFKSLIKPLKALQDNLGLFNDYSVQQDSLTAFLAELKGGDSARNLEMAQSVGALIAVLHQRQLSERAQVVESFSAFNSETTQKTFRDLFHGGRK